jgi:hypothetical protein
MILEKPDAEYIGRRFVDYMSSYNRIDDHMRLKKLERIRSLPLTLPGFGHENKLFSDFNMHPEDMEFEIYEPSPSEFSTMVEITSSFCNENSIGKEIKFIVREKNTGKHVGYCRVASPFINSRPRNKWFGQVPDMTSFNKHAVMGFIIVPTQPFGFNYLGGKLLALLCASHEFREMFDKKYDMETCLFETTSLYGNIKQASQYDGLKPFMRYTGDTISNFLLPFSDDFWLETMNWFASKNNGQPLFSRKKELSVFTSYKLRMQGKMTSIIKNSLKFHNSSELLAFSTAIQANKDVTTQKRFYISTYGYENSKNYILGTDKTLIKSKENFDKHYSENIIRWWKKKATSRYENVIADGRLRSDLEIWSTESIKKIDIIR